MRRRWRAYGARRAGDQSRQLRRRRGVPGAGVHRRHPAGRDPGPARAGGGRRPRRSARPGRERAGPLGGPRDRHRNSAGAGSARPIPRRCWPAPTRRSEKYEEALPLLGRTRDRSSAGARPPALRRVARRQRRRREARDQLRAALDMFEDMGLDGFAERARVELRATGEHVRKREVGSPGGAHPAGGADRGPGEPGGAPTGRSPLSCSSARAPWSTTCARCSGSSE